MSSNDADRRQDLGLAWLPPEADPDPHDCSNGWLPDKDGCAVPCKRCKPHLRPGRLPDGRASWQASRGHDQTPPPVSSYRKGLK